MKKALVVGALALMVAPAALATTSCQPESIEPHLEERIRSVERVPEGSWTWRSYDDCSVCHAREAETMAQSPCGIAQATERPCLSCHSDVAVLADIHTVPFKTYGASKLLETEADSGACGGCHADDELAAAIPDDAYLVDREGTRVNPHALPKTDGHVDLECADCHKAHTAFEAQRLCEKCHHRDVFACGTCHSKARLSERSRD